MSVLAFGDGDLFRFTIVKYLSTNPDRKWGNNYEAVSAGDGVTTDLADLGNVLVAYERDLHHDLIRFDRIRISTWEEDSVPYDPSAFISLPLTGTGTRASAGSDPLALNVCLDVGRVPLSGRFGHAFYRGALREIDVTAPAGKFTLANAGEWSNIVGDAITDSGLDTYLGGLGPILNIAMVNKTGTQVRQVAYLTPRGVAVVPFDHAWFNRTTGGA